LLSHARGYLRLVILQSVRPAAGREDRAGSASCEAATSQSFTALGGSTNAIVHLLAVARRAGAGLKLDDFDQIGSEVPLLVDLKPSGSGYMQDFHHAWGVPVLPKALESRLDLDHVGTTGRKFGELLEGVAPPAAWQTTIASLDHPIGPSAALAVLRGSLPPNGAVIKASAASPELMRHEGPALVFDSPEEAARQLDDPELDVTADHAVGFEFSPPPPPARGWRRLYAETVLSASEGADLRFL
jgi:dihydroxy-acid dehydratase